MAPKHSAQLLRHLRTKGLPIPSNRSNLHQKLPQARELSTSTRLQTDGVFRALTENRVQTPWIEALRNKQREGHDPTQASGKPETPKDRDLSPKKMSDSYHSVVRVSDRGLSIIRLTDAALDPSAGQRPMAIRHLPQLLRTHSTWHYLHGPRRLIRSGGIQTHGRRSHHSNSSL